ncbi:MAG: hypothetical protein GTO63_27700, partial [Anaerolineae bacterium]|nr:hypothetical protein [Anaerolineae bacterium]NIO00392.1 hypothetical protein [Anaerolineae bacterium]NIQ83162.1 hypothetical protein [Anaerolineae bacterium]
MEDIRRRLAEEEGRRRAPWVEPERPIPTPPAQPAPPPIREPLGPAKPEIAPERERRGPTPAPEPEGPDWWLDPREQRAIMEEAQRIVREQIQTPVREEIAYPALGPEGELRRAVPPFTLLPTGREEAELELGRRAAPEGPPPSARRPVIPRGVQMAEEGFPIPERLPAAAPEFDPYAPGFMGVTTPGGRPLSWAEMTALRASGVTALQTTKGVLDLTTMTRPIEAYTTEDLRTLGHMPIELRPEPGSPEYTALGQKHLIDRLRSHFAQPTLGMEKPRYWEEVVRPSGVVEAVGAGRWAHEMREPEAQERIGLMVSPRAFWRYVKAGRLRNVLGVGEALADIGVTVVAETAYWVERSIGEFMLRNMVEPEQFAEQQETVAQARAMFPELPGRPEEREQRVSEYTDLYNTLYDPSVSEAARVRTIAEVARMAYSPLPNQTKAAERILGGEDPDTVIGEEMDPVSELIGQLLLDPVNWLAGPAIGRVVRGAKAARNAKFWLGSRATDPDTLRFIGLTSKWTKKGARFGLIPEAIDPFALTRGARAAWAGDAAAGLLNRLACRFVDEPEKLLAALKGLDPDWKNVARLLGVEPTSEGSRLAHTMLSGVIDPETIGKWESLSGVGKAVQLGLEGTGEVRKAFNVAEFMDEATAKIYAHAQKAFNAELDRYATWNIPGRLAQSVRGGVSTVYLGWNPGWLARNTWNNFSTIGWDDASTFRSIGKLGDEFAEGWGLEKVPGFERGFGVTEETGARRFLLRPGAWVEKKAGSLVIRHQTEQWYTRLWQAADAPYFPGRLREYWPGASDEMVDWVQRMAKDSLNPQQFRAQVDDVFGRMRRGVITGAAPEDWTDDALEFVARQDIEDFVYEWQWGEPTEKARLWHATTNQPALEAEGFKTGVSAGLGGPRPDLVSATYSEYKASSIADQLREAVPIARGDASPAEVLDIVVQRVGAGDAPGGAWDVLRAGGVDVPDWSLWDELDPWAWVDENYGDEAYTLYQELLQGNVREIEEVSGVPEGIIDNIINSDAETVAKIDPDKIGVVQVEARKGATPEHVWQERELRFTPTDVRVAGQPAEEAARAPVTLDELAEQARAAEGAGQAEMFAEGQDLPIFSDTPMYGEMPGYAPPEEVGTAVRLPGMECPVCMGQGVFGGKGCVCGGTGLREAAEETLERAAQPRYSYSVSQLDPDGRIPHNVKAEVQSIVDELIENGDDYAFDDSMMALRGENNARAGWAELRDSLFYHKPTGSLVLGSTIEGLDDLADPLHFFPRGTIRSIEKTAEIDRKVAQSLYAEVIEEVSGRPPAIPTGKLNYSSLGDEEKIRYVQRVLGDYVKRGGKLDDFLDGNQAKALQKYLDQNPDDLLLYVRSPADFAPGPMSEDELLKAIPEFRDKLKASNQKFVDHRRVAKMMGYEGDDSLERAQQLAVEAYKYGAVGAAESRSGLRPVLVKVSGDVGATAEDFLQVKIKGLESWIEGRWAPRIEAHGGRLAESDKLMLRYHKEKLAFLKGEAADIPILRELVSP